MVPYTRALGPATMTARAAVAKSSMATSHSFGAAGVRRPMSSTMHDNDPETLEVEKHRNLTKQQHRTSTPHKHAPGWNEKLASTSEAYVKADKDHTSPQELAEETVEYVTARYTPDDRKGPTTAYYSRDEVSGPLGSAKGGSNGVQQGVDPDTGSMGGMGGNGETVLKKTKKTTTEETIEEKTPPPAGGFV